MDDALKVTYYGHVFDASGYGEAARAYVHALHGAGVSLSVVDLMRHGRQVRDDLIESLLDRPMDPDFHLFHGIPPQWARLAFPLGNAIGMTVWETDTMPSQWHNVLSHVADVWLPCAFNVDTFRQGLGRAAFRLPHPVVSRHVNGERAAVERVAGRDFLFYSIFEWQERKGPMDLLRAYLGAFAADEGTLLVMKVNPGAAADAAAALAAVRRETGSEARVHVAAEAWTPGQIEALHARGDCYVSLHRGEGWGYPLFDAAARAVPAVATAFSGPLDYLSGDAAHLVPYELVPVRQPYVYYSPQMRWAQPDVAAAGEAMRAVRAEPEGARRRAAGLAARIRTEYSVERVGAMAAERLRELAEARPRADARRTRALRPPQPPPVPIPPDWYDEDYFEHALKSNWTGGYSWESFRGLFGDTAAYLIELFPDATSFLDVGCGKGFLVRSLRAAGRECHGLDHSPWAVAHADPEAAPFVRASAAEELTAEPVDVSVAFDLLSHLTEGQAEAFLTRARIVTRQAMLAVITSREADGRVPLDARNRDLSHVTLKPREWWHELFLRTGWRQDPLQRLGSVACQSHPLPRRMGWHVYAYSPA